MGNFLCFDLGTTKIKSALISYDGNIIYSSEEKAKTYSDDEGVYQKPEDYFDIVLKGINKIKNVATYEFKEADCFICSGQMGGILGIDENWNVIFQWSYSVDTRYSKYLSNIEEKFGEEIREKSGGTPTIAGKILWIKNEFPQKYEKVSKFINLMGYVSGKICGLKGSDAFIDYSCLTMTGLANIKESKWDRGICKKIECDIDKLPKIVKPYEVVSYIDKNVFGTKKDIKVLAGIGDQIAGFIGAGILKKGDLVDVAGTYTVLGYATDYFIPDTQERVISSVYSGIEDIYYHLAVVAVGGYLYKWFIEKFDYDDSNLESAKDTNGLYFIPYIGGRVAPPQPYYQGTFYGLKWGHDLDSIYTAMLECIGYDYDFIYSKVKELNKLKEDKPVNIKVIGGGAQNRIWNEIKASILKLEYQVMENTSFEILGNYLIARYGSDIKKGYSDLLKYNAVSILESIKPEKDRVKYYSDQKVHYRNIVDRIGEIYKDF